MSKAKQAAAQAGADLVTSGMNIGLGSGSTVAFLIDALIARCRKGLQIQAVAASEASEKQAQAGGIHLIDPNHVVKLDLVIDGADEIDPQKRMIKGGGGALLREKILASMAKEMIVIVDQKKVVPALGAFPLAVEILPFCSQGTVHKLMTLGYKGALRLNQDRKTPYLTDNENYIFDIAFHGAIANPEEENQKIKNVPGVLETGFFFDLAGRVIVGQDDGTVKIVGDEKSGES